MSRLILLVAILIGFIGNVASECANACSGHGKCTSYDMCICNRNWQANDCSERVCQFGLAHVDTPKGDLNMDGSYSNANTRLLENSFNYPYGTSEQFPNMQNSDLTAVQNSAHDYMECSNKGDCDRTTGECKCFDGYDGVACQRASCPNSCSGHGVCKNIRQLAAADNGNIYKLWDKQTTMGCECDAGFSGPDCSEKLCKHGVDPLYLDDISTVKYPVWNFATLNDNAGAFHDSLDGDAYWSIRFFDSHGEDWLTAPIKAAASCNEVMKELYALPNNVIPWESLRCTRVSRTSATAQSAVTWNIKNGEGDAGSAKDLGTDDGHGLNSANLNDDNDVEKIAVNGADRVYWIRPNMKLWESSFVDDQNGEWSTELFGSKTQTSDAANVELGGYIYRIQFWGNPGALKEPQIEVHLDGKRPTLQAGTHTTGIGFGATTDGPQSGKRVITKVWTDGQQGEDNDYFSDHCDGVQATVVWTAGEGVKDETLAISAASTLSSLSASEIKLLKRCLGDADFDTTNNVGIEDWDVGSKFYPHLIKLVRSVTTYTDGGFYAALYHDGTNFVLINPFYPPDEVGTDQYEIYTTTGTLALTSKYAEASFGFASKYIFTSRTLAEKLIDGVGDLDEFDGDISCEVGRNEIEAADGNAAYWRLGSATIGNTLKTGFNSRYPGIWASDLGNVPAYGASPAYHATRGTLANGQAYYVEHCVNKSDIITFLNFDARTANPSRINLYTAQRLFRNDYVNSYGQIVGSLQAATAATVTATTDHHAHYMTRIITTDLSTNWAASPTLNDANVNNPETFLGQHIYKFFPSKKSTYNYVAPCSNRGICDTTTGLCQCFPGYTSDACSEQSSLAI